MGTAEKRTIHPLGSDELKGIPAPPPVWSPTSFTRGSPFIIMANSLAAL